jgi:DNA-binding NarL/FixJ family response regulator
MLSVYLSKGEMDQIEVMVVEPDPYRRRGIVASLSKDPGIEVVGEAGDIVSAVGFTTVFGRLPDALIVNIDHQPNRRLRNWAILRSSLPNAKVVALTTGESERMLEFALASGFSGLQPPDVAPDILYVSLRKAIRGELDYDVKLQDRLRRVMMKPVKERVLNIGKISVSLQNNEGLYSDKLPRLTERENETLALLGKGMTNRQIAQELGITVRTVEFHVTNILRKLGVSSRVEAGLLSLWYQNRAE